VKRKARSCYNRVSLNNTEEERDLLGAQGKRKETCTPERRKALLESYSTCLPRTANAIRGSESHARERKRLLKNEEKMGVQGTRSFQKGTLWSYADETEPNKQTQCHNIEYSISSSGGETKKNEKRRRECSSPNKGERRSTASPRAV